MRSAPHKPPLILLALGRVVRGEDRLAAFPDVEEKLARLLEEFGRPGSLFIPNIPSGARSAMACGR